MNAGPPRGGAPRGNPGKQGPNQRGGKPGAGKNYLNEPLTPGRLQKETRAATNIAYRPTERAINAEKRASTARTKDLGNWWNEYLSTVQGNQAATQAAYDKAGSQTQAFIGQTSALDNANTQKLDTQAQESAALRGQTAPTAPGERAAAAQAQRNYLGAAMGGATAARGANEFAYLGEQNRIGKGQSIASRVAEQKRTRSIESDKRELAKQRGEYATKFRGEQIKNNHDYLIQLRAFGLDKKKFGAEVAGAHTEATANALKEAREQSQQGIENRQKQEEIGNEGGGGGPSASEKQAARQGRRNAMVTARNLYTAAKNPPTTSAGWAAFAQLVAAQDEVSPTEAQWAVKRLRQQIESQGVGTGTAQGEVHR